MGSNLKRKITALLDQVFPEFESQFSTIFGKTALAVLRQYPTPEKLSRAQTGKLTEVLQAASNGRFGEWKARQLKELARDSFGIPDCEGTYSALLLLYLDQFQSLQDAEGGMVKNPFDRFSVFFTGDTVFLDGAAFPLGQLTTDVLTLDSAILTEIDRRVNDFISVVWTRLQEKTDSATCSCAEHVALSEI